MYHQGSHDIHNKDVFRDIFGEAPKGEVTNHEINRNKENKEMSKKNIKEGKLIANEGKEWGKIEGE